MLDIPTRESKEGPGLLVSELSRNLSRLLATPVLLPVMYAIHSCSYLVGHKYIQVSLYVTIFRAFQLLQGSCECSIIMIACEHFKMLQLHVKIKMRLKTPAKQATIPIGEHWTGNKKSWNLSDHLCCFVSCQH